MKKGELIVVNPKDPTSEEWKQRGETLKPAKKVLDEIEAIQNRERRLITNAKRD